MLCIILSLITLVTDLEPFDNIHNMFLAVYGSASIISYAYFDKFYFWLLAFLIKKVDQPDEVIKIIEKKFENREMVFKSFGDMIKFLEENPNKRIIWKRESEESSTVKIFHYLKENYNPKRPWWDLGRYFEDEPAPQLENEGEVIEEKENFWSSNKKYLIGGLLGIATAILVFMYLFDEDVDNGNAESACS